MSTARAATESRVIQRSNTWAKRCTCIGTQPSLLVPTGPESAGADLVKYWVRFDNNSRRLAGSSWSAFVLDIQGAGGHV